MQTGIITSNRFKLHLTGAGHPESPDRITAVHGALHDSGLLEKHPVVVPEIKLPEIPDLIHSNDYRIRVKRSCESGDTIIDTQDNPICPDSYEIAILAANAVTTGIDMVISGEWNNGMVIVRPPGHHAERSMAMGFCLFNNVAIGAKYLQDQYGIEKVAIVDFDVHHGNGTQHLFEADPTVFFASMHQFPFYPGTGRETETGTGAGRGTVQNYPLPAGTGDDTYYDIIDNDLSDRILKFDPDFIIFSAGFDAHELDPIGQMNVTTEGFYNISKKLNRIATEACKGRSLSVLEGGYHLNALGESVKVHINAMAGE